MKEYLIFRTWHYLLSIYKYWNKAAGLPHTGLISCILALAPICASEELKYPQKINLRFKTIAAAELTSISMVNAITQDSQGFMWFGGASGLARYDGITLKYFHNDLGDDTSLSSHRIKDLLIDRQGRLWIATLGGGLNLYKPEKESFVSFQHNPNDPHSLSHNVIFSLFEREDGKIWVATWGGGLNLFNPDTLSFTRNLQIEESNTKVNSRNLSVVFEDHEGIVWLGTVGGGIIRFNPETKAVQSFFSDAGLSQHTAYAIYEDKMQELWVGTEGGGLYRLERTSNTFIHYRYNPEDSDTIGSNSIIDIQEDAQGILWLATEGSGLNLFNPQTGKFSHYSHEKGVVGSIASNKIRSIFQDRDGDWWFGHFPFGVSMLDPYASAFRNYHHDPQNKNSLSHSGILSFSEDKLGNLWVGTEKGLNYFNRKTGDFTHYHHIPSDSNSLPAPAVTALLEDSQGILWVGTYGGGLSRFDKTTGHFVRPHIISEEVVNLNEDSIWEIYEDKQARLWIGTATNSLIYYDRDSNGISTYKANVGKTGSITPGPIYVLYEDSSRSFWLGMREGLNLMDRAVGTFRQYKHIKGDSNSLSANFIWCIFEDSRSSLWLGTYSGGLNRFEKESGKFTTYKVPDGLPNNVVTGILEDSEGELWLSTEHGLSRFNPENETFRNYNKLHGLAGNFFNRPAHIKLKNGELVFGSTDGFTLFNPKDVFQDHLAPSVVITDFQLFNQHVNIDAKDSPLSKSISQSEALILRHDQSVFSLSFSALNYRMPQKNQYAYQLEGFDKDWNYVGNNRTATYTNLDPGNYTFRVKASNSEGLWSKQESTLSIRVLPPLWQSWQAYLSYFLLFGACIGIYFYQHTQRKRALLLAKDNALLAQKNAENANRAKSVFIANISHEIRTPLNTVMGYSQLMEKASNVTKEQQHHLAIIKHASSHLLGLINDILDISKIEAGAMERHDEDFDLAELLTGVADMFDIRCTEKRLQWQLDNRCGAPLPVHGDLGKIRQILINLLSNAVKFTDQGSVILHLTKARGDSYHFEVVDTGLGIAPEYQQEVFKSFSQTEEGSNRGGTGLGLAIAQQQVKLLGGTLNVDSQVDHGSRFSFNVKLPPTEQVISQRKDRHQHVVSLVQGTKVLALVIDDVKENRELLAALLRHISVDVEVASNGREALDYLYSQVNKQLPDIIFMDMKMPDMDGIETLHHLKKVFGEQTPQVVVITAEAMKHSVDSYLHAGFSHYISKPYRFEAIYECMLALLDIDFEYSEEKT